MPHITSSLAKPKKVNFKRGPVKVDKLAPVHAAAGVKPGAAVLPSATASGGGKALFDLANG